MVKGDYTVYLTVIDSYVYDFDQNVVDIIYGLQNYDRVILDLKGESPDFKCLGISSTLEKIISTYSVEYGRIILKTGNLIETYTGILVETDNKLVRTDRTGYDKIHMKVAEPNKNIKKHFGIYVGRGNYPRLALASYLDYFYNDLTDMTYHCDLTSAYSKSHIGLNELLHNLGSRHPISKAATNFIHKVPVNNETTYEYPITSSNTVSSDITTRYDNIFVDLVCETMFSGDTFGLWTEKTKRPIMLKTPFLIFGPRGFLKNLQNMGYKTFGNWWDENYDNSEGINRVIDITRIVDNLAKMNLTDITKMYDDMSEVLNYNRELSLERTKNYKQLDYEEVKKQFSVSR